MKKNALVQVRIDERILADAEEVIEAHGITVSDLMRSLLYLIARDRRLPFNPLVPNEETIAAMREARAMSIKKGKKGCAHSVTD